MNKIIWISSYPKSGNTWMRYLISNYFFNKSNNFDANIIENIKKFNLDDEIVNSVSKKENFIDNPFNVSKYWIESQKRMKILNGNVAFLKTHNALINISNNEFTNAQLSLAIIYIVRDPRDVAISYSKYRNLSYDKIINHMVKKDKPIPYVRELKYPSDIEITGSWSFHYNSWRSGIPTIPRIIVKYEDLIKDTKNVFLQTMTFLSNILKFEVNLDKLEKSIELSNFENLQKHENNMSFFENYGGDKFFRKGGKNNWVSELNKKQQEKIENNFNQEMKLLGYL